MSHRLGLFNRCWRSRAAYLEKNKLLSGISKIQCCPCPNHRCQLLVVVKIPVWTCFLPPASQTERTVAALASGLRVRVRSGVLVRCAPSSHSSNPDKNCQSCCSSLFHFFPSPALMPTSLWLVPELLQSLSDWGLAGIKQLNAWADYFRDSLPPVPSDVYLSLFEGWAEQSDGRLCTFKKGAVRLF